MREDTSPGSAAERIGSLSERQREVLGLVSRDHGSKEIARSLGLSEETVKNHIKAAMRKLGTSTRYDAARLVRLHETHDPRVVIDPARVIAAATPTASAGNEHGDVAPFGRTATVLREERALFDAGAAAALPDDAPAPDVTRGEHGHGLTPLQIFGWVAVITVALAIAGIAAAPLAHSAQEIANLIETPVNTH